MAAEAAMYSGAGLVSVATHPTSVSPLVARRPEVMTRGVTTVDELKALINRATVVVVGPGLDSDSAWGSELFNFVLESELPMIIDADGLNLLSRLPGNSVRRDNWILTPHPGEARNLLEKDVQVNRLVSVRQLQEKYGGVCLLKGAGTLIASRHDVRLCPYGNPGMSVAGMGDVLSGIIGGLVAQGLVIVDAASLGVIVHSLAADNIAARQGEGGLLATQLLPEIRRLLNRMPA
jgi:NAD(P)H-hydrate epimerase